MVRITVTEKGGPVRRFEFDKNEITVGRVQGNDIILAKGNVSKRHARVALENGQLLLEDLNSTNGTYVNGRRLSEPYTLRPGDRIFIGDFVIEPAEHEVAVTQRRGSGDVQPDRPVDLEDPVADLSKRRQKQERRELPVDPEPAPAPAPSRPPRPAPVPPPPASASVDLPPLAEPVRPARAAPPEPAARPAPSVDRPPARRATAPVPVAPVVEAPRPASRAAAPEPIVEEERQPSRPVAPQRAEKLELGRIQPAQVPPRSIGAIPTPVEYGRLLASARRKVGERFDLARAGIFGDELRKRIGDAAREIIATGLADGSIPPAVDTETLYGDVVAEIVGFGPLEDLLADTTVNEILVNDASAIFVDRAGQLTRVPRAFSSSEALMEVVRRLIGKGGAGLPEDEPLIETRLGDGTRLIAVLPPFAPNGPSLVLRKVVRQSRSLPELVRGGMLSEGMARFLELCVRGRRNVVLSGGAGAGKSALLSAVAASIGAEDRVVLVEEVAELALSLPNLVSLQARVNAEDGREATLRDLVRGAMRLRPDWLVVGDCRGAEAFDLAQAMAGGRDGTLVAVTAHGVADTLARLASMSALAGDVSSRTAREAANRGVHFVVQLSRGPDGSRRTTQIAEVSQSGAGDEPVLTDVFLGDARGHYVPTGHIPKFVDELTRRGETVDLSIFRS